MIKVLDKPHLDLTTPLGRGFIAFLPECYGRRRAPAHFEAANDGRRAAKAKGIKLGRKPKLTDHSVRRLAVGSRLARAPEPSPTAV